MDTMLSPGASGECVVQLTALARAAGVQISQYGPDKPLDTGDATTIVASLGLADRDVREALAGQPYKGTVIDQAVWDELRIRAAANTGLTVPPSASAADSQPVPPAGAESALSTAAGEQPAPIQAAQPGAGAPSS